MKTDFNISTYTLDDYHADISAIGIERTWERILDACWSSYDPTALFSIAQFGELYENGLAYADKIEKKEAGKYFTPTDVSDVMARWFNDLQGDALCDVCCGTGNLILSALRLMGKEKAVAALKEKKIYLYDSDPLALKICAYSIALVYGKKYKSHIRLVCGDFLDQTTRLPENAKVICNPPYYKMTKIKDTYEQTDALLETREFYSAIMEKILRDSRSSVIITPYSFISGAKFFALRKEMNRHTGFVVSFDNVPANIFKGKKQGIFNSNSAISVRAAITVTQGTTGKGYRISPLIRFKTDERERILQNKALENTLPDRFQKVDKTRPAYHKCARELEDFYEKWATSSAKSAGEVSAQTGPYVLCVSNSCRYFTVATKRRLEREGKYDLYFETREAFDLMYALLNSSFNYWHWRLFDGGINYSHTLLNSLPSDFDFFSVASKKQLIDIARKMQKEEDRYLVYKKNAGAAQESVKFPAFYRKKINQIICAQIDKDFDYRLLDALHSNRFFQEAV